MKIKILISCTSFLFLLSGIYAQDHKVYMGPAAKPINDFQLNKVLGVSGEHLYLYKDQWSSQGVKHYTGLEKYSAKDLKLVYSKEFSSKMPKTPEGEKTEFRNLILVDGKLILLSYTQTLPNNLNYMSVGTKYALYGTPVSPEGVIGTTATLLMSEDSEPKAKNNGVGSLVTSDTMKLFVYAGTAVNGKIRCKVINSDLTMAAEGTISMDLAGNSELSQLMISKDYKLFCLAKETLPKSEWFTKEIEKYTRRIVAFDIKKGTMVSTVIPSRESPAFCNISFKYRDDVIQVVHYYSEAKKTKAISGGVSYCKFKTSTLELLSHFDQNFDNGTFDRLMENSEISDSGWNPPNKISSLERTKVVGLKNGGNVIVSEQVPVGAAYGYYNLLVTHVNAKGEFVRFTVIPKRQKGTWYRFYSFHASAKENTLSLIFMDNPKNLNLPDPYKLEGSVASIRGTTTVIVSVEETGAWKKEALLDNKDLPPLFVTDSFKGNSEEWYFYGHNDEKNQFVKVTF